MADHTIADRYTYCPASGCISLWLGAERGSAPAEPSCAGRWALRRLGDRLLGGLRRLANFVLAQRRNAVDACLGRDGRNQQSRIWPGRHLCSSWPSRRGSHPLSPGRGIATDSAPFNSLGALLAREGNYEEAIAQFRRALEIDPNLFLTLVNLGMALSRQGRYDKAGEEFQRTIEIDPRGSRVHRELAHLLFLDGKAEEARAELELAIDIDPRDVVARDNLGAVLFKLGKIDEAITQFEAALAIDPKYLAGPRQSGPRAGRARASRRRHRRMPQRLATRSQ